MLHVWQAGTMWSDNRMIWSDSNPSQNHLPRDTVQTMAWCLFSKYLQPLDNRLSPTLQLHHIMQLCNLNTLLSYLNNSSDNKHHYTLILH